jgi:hypothetical protein
VNSKKEISYDFCLDFVQEFVLSSVVLENIIEKVYCTQKRSLCQILLKLYGWLIHYPLSNPRPSHAFYLTSTLLSLWLYPHSLSLLCMDCRPDAYCISKEPKYYKGKGLKLKVQKNKNFRLEF